MLTKLDVLLDGINQDQKVRLLFDIFLTKLEDVFKSLIQGPKVGLVITGKIFLVSKLLHLYNSSSIM